MRAWLGAGAFLLVALPLCGQQQGLLRSEKWVGSADVRNRFVQDVGGNSQVYRSVVNLGEGPRLFGGDLRFADPAGRWADRLQLTMSSWGGDPYNTARLDAGKKGLYDLRLNYRNLAYFNNLPSFANPLLGEGLLVSERALDVTRRHFDLELTIKPQSWVSPFFGFYNADGSGRGITTYVADGNEFPVDTDLDDRLTSVRGGVEFSGRRWGLTLEQGATDFSDGQEVFWDREGNRGNRRSPFLGRDLTLDRLMQRYRADGSGVFSRALVQGQPFSELSFTGQFLYSQPKIDVKQDLEAQGSLVFQPLLTPYTGIFEQSLSEASRPHSSGSWTTELQPHSRVRVIQSWYTDRYHISGASTLAQVLNALPGETFEEAATNTLIFNFNQNQVDVVVDAAPWATLRGGHRYVWGDAEAPAPSLQFGPEPRTQGEIRRHVGLAGAAMRFWKGRLRVTADFEGSPGDETFFRTGLMDYRRGKLLARYKLSPSVSVTGSFRILDNQNTDPDIDLDFQSRQTSFTLEWTPAGGRFFSVLADYTRSTLRSDIRIVDLPFFGTDFSRYRDSGHHGGLYAETPLPGKAVLRAGGSLSVNSGSRPVRFYTPTAEIRAPLNERIYFIAEWRWYSFNSRFLRLENFRTHTFSTGLEFGL